MAYTVLKKLSLTSNPNNGIMLAMAKWIRKVEGNLTAFRVSIPKVVVDKKGWQGCRFVTIDDSYGDYILIGRLPGEEKRNNEGGKYIAVADRPPSDSGQVID